MKRRILALCLTLVMFVTIIPTTSFAVDAPALTVSAASITAGETGSVTVSISNNTGFDTISFKIQASEGLTINSVTADGICTGWNADYGTATGLFSAYTGTGSATIDGVVCTISFTVASSASGELNITLAEDTNADGTLVLEDEAVEGVTLGSGVITVTGGDPVVPPAGEGYTATLTTNSANNEVASNGSINVIVGVSHSSDTVFNAGEIILSYDGTKLTPNVAYIKDTLKLNYEIVNPETTNAKLIIEDFGANKDLPYNYEIPFTATEVTGNANVETIVTLASAKFLDKAAANESDLEDASVSATPLTITIIIKVATVQITLTNNADNSSTVITVNKGADYTFAPADTANYNYTGVAATVGGQTINITDNDDGTWTIPAASVTDDIVITYTKAAKTYAVTWTGDLDGITQTSPATFGLPFAFQIPANKEAGSEPGWNYVVKVTYTDTNTEITPSTSNGEGVVNYIIEGSKITAPITINVTKNPLAANIFAVAKDGDGSADATIVNENGQVALNSAATIRVTQEVGYNYTITATMGDAAATVVPGENGLYTVEAVTANVTFHIAKVLDVTSVKVYEYVNLNGESEMYLVTFSGTLASGKAPLYDENVMYWSEKYDAYCYLVIAEELTSDTAMIKVTADTVSENDRKTVEYGMDLNATRTIDAADAQFVWNMYNAEYNNFDTVTMDQFLNADQNAISTDTNTWKLTVEDAAAIIQHIFNNN